MPRGQFGGGAKEAAQEAATSVVKFGTTAVNAASNVTEGASLAAKKGLEKGTDAAFRGIDIGLNVAEGTSLAAKKGLEKGTDAGFRGIDLGLNVAQGASEVTSDFTKKVGTQAGTSAANILGKTGDLTVSGMQEIANTLSTMKDISKRTGEAISVRLNELEEDRLGNRSTQKETTSKLKDITGGKALDLVKKDLKKRMADRGKSVIGLLISMKRALTNLVCEKQSIVKRYIFDKRCNPAFADSLVKTQEFIDLLIAKCNMTFMMMLNKLVGANSVTIGEIYESQIAFEATMMGKANTRFTEFTNAIEASLGLSATPVDSYGANPQEMDPPTEGGRKRKRTKRKRKTRRTRRYIHSP